MRHTNRFTAHAHGREIRVVILAGGSSAGWIVTTNHDNLPPLLSTCDLARKNDREKNAAYVNCKDAPSRCDAVRQTCTLFAHIHTRAHTQIYDQRIITFGRFRDRAAGPTCMCTCVRWCLTMAMAMTGPQRIGFSNCLLTRCKLCKIN